MTLIREPTFISPDGLKETFLPRKTKVKTFPKGWKFERLEGDISLLKRLVDADWNEEEFLVVRSGEKIVPTYIGGIIRAQAADGERTIKR